MKVHYLKVYLESAHIAAVDNIPCRALIEIL
jgi:hypothetical protein